MAMPLLGENPSRASKVACPRCRQPLRHESLHSGEQACPSCGGRFELVRFDPPGSRVEVPELAGVGPSTGAPCARHSRNRAEAACARCGQFMCSLCSICSEGQAFCPSCFERLTADGTLAGSVTRLWNWGGLSAASLFANLTLWALVLPLAGWMFGIAFAILGIKDKKSRGETDGLLSLYLLLILNGLVGVGSAVALAAAFGLFPSGGPRA